MQAQFRKKPDTCVTKGSEGGTILCDEKYGSACRDMYESMKKDLQEFFDRDTKEDEDIAFCEYFAAKY